MQSDSDKPQATMEPARCETCGNVLPTYKRDTIEKSQCTQQSDPIVGATQSKRSSEAGKGECKSSPKIRNPYLPSVFAEIVISNYEKGKRVMGNPEDWYELAKSYKDAEVIMRQNNCVAVASDKEYYTPLCNACRQGQCNSCSPSQPE